MKSDEELMVIYVSGESSAFSELYRRYKNRVYGYLQGKIRPGELDDVFQKIFLKLHAKRHLFKEEYPFAPWFFTLCRHVIIDHYRLQKDLDFEELARELKAEEGELEGEAMKVPQMDPEQYRLLYMKFVEGRGYKELEEEFQANASTLRKRVSRIISALRGEK